MEEDIFNKQMSRREFLKKSSIIAAGTAIMPSETFASWGDEFAWDKELEPLFESSSIFTQDDVKSLNFYNTHTGKKTDLVYYENGQYIDEALDEINIIMGDFRENKYISINRKLIDTIYDVKKLTNSKKPINILSAYRTRKTNNYLRRNMRGVAKDSFHIKGMAIDINIQNVSLRNIKNAAMTLRKGGIGYYPRSNFVHLDVGKFRTWRG